MYVAQTTAAAAAAEQGFLPGHATVRQVRKPGKASKKLAN